MTDTTTTLGADLDAVAARLPDVAAGLRARTLTRARQHTFGALLIELGEKLHQHADSHTPAGPRRAPVDLLTANDSEPS